MAEINDLSVTDASNTARFPENQSPSSLNDAARALEGILARWHKDSNASIAAGGTGDAITVSANQTLSAYYDGLVIAFNATAANTTTATLNVDSVGAKKILKNFNTALVANDIKVGQKVIVIYDSDGDSAAGAWQMITPLGNAGLTSADADAAYVKQGKHTIGIPASAMFPATTNGCAALAQAETSSNKINYKYMAFDASTVEHGWLVFPMPKSHNAGTVTFDIAWTHPATTTNFKVAWKLAAVAFANDDALDTALGTAVQVNDTGGTTGDFYRSDESGAVTIGNTMSKGEWVFVRISRVADDGTNDTLAVDAYLLGATMYVTLDAATDA